MKFRYIQAHPPTRKINGTWVILLEENTDCLVLNETAGVLWEALKEPQSLEDLIILMTHAFAVDRSTATRDVKEFLATYLERGLLMEAH